MRRIVVAAAIGGLVAVYAPGARATSAPLRWRTSVPNVTAEALSGGRVFVAGARHGDWLVEALDRRTGSTAWSRQTDVAHGTDTTQSIAVAGAVVVVAGRIVRGDTTNAYVQAYSAKTGAMLWHNELDRQSEYDEWSFHALAITGGTVVVGGRSSDAGGTADWAVRGLDLATGRVLWTDVRPSGAFSHAVTVAAVGANVYVGGVSTEATMQRHWTVRAYSARSGRLLWQDVQPSGTFGSSGAADAVFGIAGSGGYVVAAGSITRTTGASHQLTVRAYRADTGAVVWTRYEGGVAASGTAFAVAVAGNRVFALGSGSSFCSDYVPSNCDVLVYAYDLPKGSVLWHDQRDGAGADDQGASLAANGSTVVVGSELSNSKGGYDALLQSYSAAHGARGWSRQTAAGAGGLIPSDIVLSGTDAFEAQVLTNSDGTTSGLVQDLVLP